MNEVSKAIEKYKSYIKDNPEATEIERARWELVVEALIEKSVRDIYLGRYDKSVEDGFYLANENHERLLGKKPTLQCKYCIRINNATNNSPRKAYLYCPMCGRKRG